MTTLIMYSRYHYKTCRTTSLTQAANVRMYEGKRLLRCASGHQHTYSPEEIESFPLKATREIRAKMGLK